MHLLKLLILSGIISFILSACAPRGENKSIEEVLAKSKKRYALKLNSNSNTGIVDSLKNLTKNLEALSALSSGKDVSKLAEMVANQLEDLNQKAGYTVRPAMAELINQYMKIAEGNKSENFSSGSLKLLVSRTYSLIASELETTAFRVA